jgi:3-oxoacyl-[acyl-carrier protein] reductase
MNEKALFSLHGLTALVCGASQGIGRTTAQLLAAQGARVVLLARNAEALEKVRQSLPSSVQHLCVTADVSQPAALDAALDAALSHCGAIDILVNNAGGPAAGPLMEAEPAQFLAALNTHVLAQLQICKKLVPTMQKKKFGRIINVVSTSVRMPIPNLGVSNTTRAAVAGFAKTLSHELAPSGITVNNILPGYTDTERLSTLIQSAAERTRASQDTVRENWLKQVPMNRFAKPEEVASAIVFLASREASYITGVSLQVDGGRIGAI